MAPYFTAEYGVVFHLKPFLQSLTETSGHVTFEGTQCCPAAASLQGLANEECCFSGCGAALQLNSHAGPSAYTAVRDSKCPLICFPGFGVME